jgi:uncharacterized membrane protein YciS (DUF1049 family)
MLTWFGIGFLCGLGMGIWFILKITIQKMNIENELLKKEIEVEKWKKIAKAIGRDE